MCTLNFGVTAGKLSWTELQSDAFRMSSAGCGKKTIINLKKEILKNVPGERTLL